MKAYFLALLLLFTSFAYASSEKALAKIARQVGEAQGMSDYKKGISSKLPKLKEPKQAEGFYPNVKISKYNPYLVYLYDWAAEYLKKEEVPYGKSSKGTEIFTSLGSATTDYGTRTEMQIAKNLYFLVTKQGSKYYMNEELFRRYLSRVLAYANEYNTQDVDAKSKLNDFYAIGPAVYIMRMTKETYGDYLLPSQIQAIDDCQKKANDFWKDFYEKEKSAKINPMGKYANRDLGIANILVNTGMYCDDEESLTIARTLVRAQKDNLYDDGAFAYMGSQNDSATYHGANITFLSRYLVVTKDKTTALLLKATRNCVLLENEPYNVAEFWTAPSWRQVWNLGYYETTEAVNYLCKCPYLRLALDSKAINKKVLDAMEVPFYVEMGTKDLPEDYTIVDRNINGVRARYDNYSMAATLRETASDEPGLATLVGAMTKKLVKNRYITESALMFARPSAYGKNDKNKQLWYTLTDSLKSDILFGKNYSAWGATHLLASNAGASKGDVVEVEGTQVYLSARDHLLGYIQVNAKDSQTLYKLATTLRLGYGGYYVTVCPDLEEKGDNVYDYGNITIEVLKTNFPDFEVIDTEMIPGDQNSGIACDLTFSIGDEKKGKTFTKDEKYYILFELTPKSSTTQSKLLKFNNEEGINVSIRVAGKDYDVTYDAEANKVAIKTDDKEEAVENFDVLLEPVAEKKKSKK